jgi:alpha-tubulin suppressor-like RCC1 family protein
MRSGFASCRCPRSSPVLVTGVLLSGLLPLVPSAVADGDWPRSDAVAWGRNDWMESTVPASLGAARGIASGRQSTFAVREDRSLAAWGWNAEGRTLPPPGLSDVKMADGGELHAAALREDGTVVCWGSNGSGQSNVPAGLDDAVWIATGNLHTVAVREDGSVLCWGYGGLGVCTPPPDLGPVASVAAGGFHTVARCRDGTVACWGSNEYGQTATPAGLSGVTVVAAGDRHSLAIAADGSLTAWGWNSQGQSTVPGGLGAVRAASGGHLHTVVVRPDGTVFAWGSNLWGQCTVPSDLGTVVAVAAGLYHSISLDDRGVVRCWGMDLSGECLVPRSPRAVRDLAAGESHALASDPDGRVLAWGRGDYGQNAVPSGLGPSIAVAAGQRHSLSLDEDGLVVGWGDDTYGQASVPPGIAAVPVARIRAGWYHNLSFERMSEGIYLLRCWGKSDSGQCSIPPDAQIVADASAGGAFTIACLPSGSFRGWGSNSHGQLSPPGGLSSVIRVAAGAYHSLALRSDGTVRAFGWNEGGQCAVPASLSDATAIAAGYYHSLALRATGEVVFWGTDVYHTGLNAPPNDRGPFDSLASGFWNGLVRQSPRDSDGDGVRDPEDDCPSTADADQSDSDGDGRGDACDGCPEDSSKWLAGDCGCGASDADRNGNGQSDCLDDSDGDGVPDASDGCPLDPAKIAPGVCGCGVPDTDLDNDLRVDCLEDLPDVDPTSIHPGDVQPGDHFSQAMAADGEWLAVGSPGDRWSVAPSYGNVGSVRVFRRDGPTWNAVTTLGPTAVVPETYFGSSIALDGNTLALGNPMHDAVGALDSGAVEIHDWNGVAWIKTASLRPEVPAVNEQFGFRVAVRGDLLAVGMPLADPDGFVNAGQVLVYRRVAGTWTRIASLRSSPPAADDRFGQSVAFGGDPGSPILVVGCPRDDQPGRRDCGAVYVHRLDADGNPIETTRLLTPGPMAGAMLGTCVTVDSTGSCIAAGAPPADLPDLGDDAGQATIWLLEGSQWWGQTISATDQTAGERFGSSVALDPSGGLLLVGSPERTVDGIPHRGTATLFRRFGGMSWDAGTPLDLAGGAPYPVASRFGTSVAHAEGQLLSGGPQHGLPFSGAVAIFAAPVSCVGDDSDGDGLSDACDACPGDIAKTLPEACGCGVAETDSDLDGTPDCLDGCPLDPAKLAPGVCGCGTPDLDADLDTIFDCLDSDDDNDGVPDESDGCPLDPLKSEPGLCGCGASDLDTDGDATPDCLDGCIDDPGKTEPGICGCGVADEDLDADGLVDCLAAGHLVDLGALVAPGTVAGDDFGSPLATAGALLAVGAPLDDTGGKTDAGSVAVFRRDEFGVWNHEARLVAPVAQARSSFGSSVAVDGETITVGAPLTDVGGLADAGLAYRFRRTGPGTWTLVDTLTRPGAAAGDRFGQSVAARDGLVAVGAPKANALGLSDSGEVRVYREESLSLVERLVVTGESAADSFGQSVAIGGETDAWWLHVGVPGDDEGAKTNCGAVHALPITDAPPRTRLLAPTPIRNAGLGACVAARGGGPGIGRVVAGAPSADLPDLGTDCGQVVVWSQAELGWTASEVRPADQVAGERLGSSVALAEDGFVIVAGSPNDTVGGIAGRGSAAVLFFDGTLWKTLDRLTLPADGTSASRFGSAVALAPWSFLVGGPRHTPPAGGTVREFTLPPP